MLSVGARRFFLPPHCWSLFFGRKYREKVQHLLQMILFSPFPQLLHRKDSLAPAALSAGAGHFFPFLIQPHPSSNHNRDENAFFVDLLVQFTKTTTKCYVDCNTASGFLSAAKRDPTLHISVFDIIDHCSTLFIGNQGICIL